MEADYTKSTAQPIKKRKELPSMTAFSQIPLTHDKHYKNMVDDLPQIVYEIDTKGNFLYCNKFGLNTLGYRVDDLKNSFHISQAIHPDDLERAVSDIDLIVQGQEGFSAEYRAVRRDGSTFPVKVLAQQVLNEGVLVGIRGTVLDVSNLRRAEKALKESETLYRALFETTGTATVMVDDNSIIQKCNSQFETLSAYSREEIEGKMKWMDFVDEVDRERMVQYHAKRLKEKTPPKEYDFSFVAREGIKKYVQIIVRVIPDTNIRVCSLTDVTKRKQTEIALRESELRFKTLHNASFGGITIHDKGIILDCNQGLADITGYNVDELIGMDGLQLIAEKSRAKVMDAIVSQYEEPYEATGLRKNGEEYPLRLAAKQIPYKGKIVRVVEFRDITEQKRAEGKIQTQANYLQTIIDSTPDGFCVLNRQGKIVEVNRAFSSMSGYSREELLGMSLDKIHAGKMSEEDYTRNQRVISNTSETFEAWHRRKDGSKYLIEISVTYQAEPDEQFICFCRDITERKRAEEALEKRIIALTRPLSEDIPVAIDDLFNMKTLQNIQDTFASATGVASLITTPDGTPITKPSNFTRFCKELIRNTPKGCANCRRSDALLGTPNAKGPIIQQCLSGGLWDAGASINIGGRHVANWLIGQVRNQTQSEVAIRKYAHEIETDEEELVKAFYEVPSMPFDQFKRIAQLVDAIASQLSSIAYQNIQQARLISDLKTAEVDLKGAHDILENKVEVRTRELAQKATELEQANQELLHLDELKSNLVSTVSHELRTPLTSIFGFTKLIKKDLTKQLGVLCASSPETERYYKRAVQNLDIIESEGRRLVRLINDFLDLSKIESGKMQWNDTEVSPGALINQSAALVDSLFKEKGDVKLNIKVQPDLPTIHVDEDRMIQVLVNLLSNAYKFTLKGVVTITASMDDKNLIFAVSDTGKGILPEDIENIFQKFYQRSMKSSESGITSGTGLGLAISKQIVEHYNGTISVNSGYGKGSTFFVTFTPDLSRNLHNLI